jgi:hypothetical protein
MITVAFDSSILTELRNESQSPGVVVRRSFGIPMITETSPNDVLLELRNED